MNDSIMRTIPIFLAIIRYFLAALFLISSVNKIREPRAFVKTVSAYRLLPIFAIRPFAFLLPWIEFILGMVLLIGWETSLAAAATGMLFLVFATALMINLTRGRKDLGCGCFGSKNKHKITPWLVSRDIGLAAAAGLVTFFGGGIFAFDNLSRGVQSIEIQVIGEFLLPSVLIATGLFTCFMLFQLTLRLISLSTKNESK